MGVVTRCSGGLVVLAILAGCRAQVSSTQVDDARLLAADKDSANWLTYGRTYSEQRFSPLTQINDTNVGHLGLAWSHELPTTRGVEATPLVLDGILYTTSSWSVVYAFDAVSGQQLWTYDPHVDRTRARTVCCDVVNRGLALYRDHLYLGTLDGRLVALNARTGVPLWDVRTIDTAKPYSITGAPIIVKGRVLIGNAGAEYGVRGYVSAYDAETGALAWRVYTVPGDPAKGFETKAIEAAARTWTGTAWAAGAGGTAWGPIVYDPDLDLVYFGTGNGTAWYRALRSPAGGDNLYLASIIAVRGATGEQVWHYQVTPGENWDYDATQPLVLANLVIGGQPRQVVMQASKNGFFYVLDRSTGQFISATPFVDGVTWASRIDSISGRPVESPSAYAGTKAVLVSPDPFGAHNWYPIAFNPKSGLVYFSARNASLFLHAPDSHWVSNASAFNIGYDYRYSGPLLAQLGKAPLPRGELVAWDPITRRAAWRARLPVSESGGVLTSAGNLVFQGSGDGMLSAYRATDGSRLWQFDAGTGIMAPPVTYVAGGTQYVTVMAGWGGASGHYNIPNMGPVKPGFGRVLTFRLGGAAKLTPTVYEHATPPAAIVFDTTGATIREGGALYYEHCTLCHGLNVVAGPIPDLRYSTAATFAQYDSIVLGGARSKLGMPSFADKLKPLQVHAIEAYVLSRARAASAQQSQ